MERTEESARYRRRKHIVIAGWLLATVMVTALPALLWGISFARSAFILLPGFVGAFGWIFVQASASASEIENVTNESFSFKTWLGSATIEFHELKTVRCRRLHTRVQVYVRPSVVDSRGVWVNFDRRSGDSVVNVIRSTYQSEAGVAVGVSRKAMRELEIPDMGRPTLLPFDATSLITFLPLAILPIVAAVVISTS